MAAPEKPSIHGLSKDALEAWLAEIGEKPYRGKQILDWLYAKRVTDFVAMSNLSESLREQLVASFSIDGLQTVRVQGSEDTTRKFLFRLGDGRLIETVLIPASVGLFGEKADRRTLCVSSQVGCAYDCKFCASGLAGFTRNLTAAEIVQQVLQAEKESGDTINNLVFMGMGEPLANLTNLRTAIQILNGHWGLNIGARRMTVSTSGLAPQIEKLADEPVQIRLAISLHGACDEVRERIMPVNRKYPLERLFAALKVWGAKKKQRLTFEYILIAGVNDGLDQAGLLAKRAKSVGALVNLIPYNKVEGLPWERPSPERQEAFYEILKGAGANCTLRREKGHDIDAACGQLRLQQETAEGVVDVVG
jgi:23S rRNA (adenine2503-C2)-methyltransferase